jgi:hypothetical protein
MKNVLAVICFALIIVAFFGLWGTMGALEQDMITLTTSVKRSAVLIVVLVAAGLGLWRLEREDCEAINGEY